jgi:hypothetical protein
MTTTQPAKTSIFENQLTFTAIWAAAFIILVSVAYYAPGDTAEFNLGLRIFCGITAALIMGMGLTAFWQTRPKITYEEVSGWLRTAIRFCEEVPPEEYYAGEGVVRHSGSCSGLAFLIDKNTNYDLIPKELEVCLQSLGYRYPNDKTLHDDEPKNDEHDDVERVVEFAYRKRAVTYDFTFKRVRYSKNQDLAVCLVRMSRSIF